MACASMPSWVHTTKAFLGCMAMCMVWHVGPLLHIMTLVATVTIAMVPATTVLLAVTMVVPVVATTAATLGSTPQHRNTHMVAMA